MKLWKLLDFVISYSVAELKYFVRNFNKIISATASGFESCQPGMRQLRDDQSWCQRHHCTCQCTYCLSNFLGICNKLKPNPLSKLSIVLRIAGTLIFCWSAIILTVIVMTSKDYESSRVTKTLTLAPPWIYSQFWTHFEDRERISEVELVTGYSGMSSVYIYTGPNMPRQGTLQSGRSCCDIIICVARLSLWKFNCQLSDTFCGRLHVGHVWLTECSDLWHVSLVWRMQMQPLQHCHYVKWVSDNTETDQWLKGSYGQDSNQSWNVFAFRVLILLWVLTINL